MLPRDLVDANNPGHKKIWFSYVHPSRVPDNRQRIVPTHNVMWCMSKQFIRDFCMRTHHLSRSSTNRRLTPIYSSSDWSTWLFWFRCYHLITYREENWRQTILSSILKPFQKNVILLLSISDEKLVSACIASLAAINWKSILMVNHANYFL